MIPAVLRDGTIVELAREQVERLLSLSLLLHVHATVAVAGCVEGATVIAVSAS